MNNSIFKSFVDFKIGKMEAVVGGGGGSDAQNCTTTTTTTTNPDGSETRTETKTNCGNPNCPGNN